MAPTLSHISLVGKLRITFKPLLSKVPCIGAMVFSLLSPPKLNFKIDVGKALGGNAVGSTVKKALGPFIKDTLMNMLVWPKRYVVPIMVSLPIVRLCRVRESQSSYMYSTNKAIFISSSTAEFILAAGSYTLSKAGRLLNSDSSRPDTMQR